MRQSAIPPIVRGRSGAQCGRFVGGPQAVGGVAINPAACRRTIYSTDISVGLRHAPPRQRNLNHPGLASDVPGWVMTCEYQSGRAGCRVPDVARGLRNHIHPTIRWQSSPATGRRHRLGRHAPEVDIRHHTRCAAVEAGASGRGPQRRSERRQEIFPAGQLRSGRAALPQGGGNASARRRILGRPWPRPTTGSSASISPTAPMRRPSRLIGATPEVMNNQGFSYMLRGDYGRARAMLLAAQAKDSEKPLHRQQSSAAGRERAQGQGRQLSRPAQQTIAIAPLPPRA